MQVTTKVLRNQYQKIKPFLQNRNLKSFGKTKKLTQIAGVLLLSVPAQSNNFNSDLSDNSAAYNNVVSTGQLTVASVKGSSTFFSTDEFQHGFGYDIARAYAQKLGVKIVIKNFESEDAVLKAVASNEADMALTTANLYNIENHNLASVNLSCGFDEKLTTNGLHPSTNFSFKSRDDYLAINASDFLCSEDQLAKTTNIANFYDQSLLQDDYNRNHFKKILDNNLPNYKASFQEQADHHNLDWQLLVAMGYQESQLDANAVSPTGVKGLMMLTNNTAKAMGVSDRVDPHQSISGGARYLDKMQGMFLDVPNPDRLWFSLASYNMGPYAVKKIQKKLIAQGKDPNSWSNVYTYMSDNSHNNSRYVQCMHYVTSIRSYLESLKVQTV